MYYVDSFFFSSSPGPRKHYEGILTRINLCQVVIDSFLSSSGAGEDGYMTIIYGMGLSSSSQEVKHVLSNLLFSRSMVNNL